MTKQAENKISKKKEEEIEQQIFKSYSIGYNRIWHWYFKAVTNSKLQGRRCRSSYKNLEVDSPVERITLREGTWPSVKTQNPRQVQGGIWGSKQPKFTLFPLISQRSPLAKCNWRPLIQSLQMRLAGQTAGWTRVSRIAGGGDKERHPAQVCKNEACAFYNTV